MAANPSTMPWAIIAVSITLAGSIGVAGVGWMLARDQAANQRIIERLDRTEAKLSQDDAEVRQKGREDILRLGKRLDALTAQQVRVDGRQDDDIRRTEKLIERLDERVEHARTGPRELGIAFRDYIRRHDNEHSTLADILQRYFLVEPPLATERTFQGERGPK